MTFIILITGTFFYFISSSKSNVDNADNSNNMNSNIFQNKINNNDNSNSMENRIGYVLNGIQEYSIYIKTDSEGIQKLFYYHPVSESIDGLLSEGNIEEYQIHSIGGQKYYPLILGYEEAKIMRQEGIFYNIGDPIKNFFGKNVVIIGVFQRTGGALDIAHLMPLTRGELN